MQDAMGEAWKVYPKLKLKVFVDNMKPHAAGNVESSMVVSKRKNMMQEVKLKLSLTEGEEEEKNKRVAFHEYLE